jgi:hypothetical protein
MGAIFELVLQLLAGVGLTVAVEKFAPAPNPVNPQTGIASWGPLRIGLFVIILAAGAMIFLWINKKFLHIGKRHR